VEDDDLAAAAQERPERLVGTGRGRREQERAQDQRVDHPATIADRPRPAQPG